MKMHDDEGELVSDVNISLILLEKILDVIPNCIVSINRNGNIIYMNNQYGSLLGIKKSDIYGHFVRDTISPDSQLPNVARGAPPTHNQTLMVHGHRLIVNQVPIRYGDEIVGAVGIALFTEAQQILSLAKSLFSINLDSESMSPPHLTPPYWSHELIGKRQPKPY